ncbi:MAG: aminotransferase class V-fold PLP-dependent enzyme [Alkalicoccus sp.]|nr:MAG: aminotransferase class V-fold PLP-dependent enzyme [Alkalicoccus sp.]
MTIYLDYAAGAPMPAEAVETWCRAQQDFAANPSSLHEPGARAADLLEAARKSTAGLIGARAEQFFFTGGGTEANHLALESLLKKKAPRHAVTTAVEHPSVLSFFEKLEQQGTTVTRLYPDRGGVISAEQLQEALLPETGLVSIQLVNSETGMMQPVAELKQAAGEVPFHTDAVQAYGRLPVSAAVLGVDALSVSAHKLGGPKQMGAVYMKDRSVWEPSWPGTTQEYGFRPGTIDVPGTAAFAAAVQALPDMRAAEKEAWVKRRKFIDKLSPAGTQIDEATNQSPYIIGLRIPGIQGQYLLALLDRYGICVSTGTACTQGKAEASPMLQALHPENPAEWGRFLRVSFGHQTTAAELEKAAETICAIVESRGDEYGREKIREGTAPGHRR